jgi:hypothetical protein
MYTFLMSALLMHALFMYVSLLVTAFLMRSTTLRRPATAATEDLIQHAVDSIQQDGQNSRKAEIARTAPTLRAFLGDVTFLYNMPFLNRAAFLHDMPLLHGVTFLHNVPFMAFLDMPLLAGTLLARALLSTARV